MLGQLLPLLIVESRGLQTASGVVAPRQFSAGLSLFQSRSGEAQSHPSQCFASFSGVPGETAAGATGKTLDRMNFVSVNECSIACNKDPACNSFIACPSLGNICFLKDYVLVPGVHEIQKGADDCQNYYKTHCNGCFRMEADNESELFTPMPRDLSQLALDERQLERCREECAGDLDCQHFVACPGRDDCYINAEKPPATMKCQRFRKYTARGQVPCLDFPVAKAPLQNPTVPRMPQGTRVAVGFHGQYQRHALREGRGEGCSDYFQSAQNIKDMIIAPLRREGTTVRTYFHTFHRNDCPAKDSLLVSSIKPTRYKFDVQSMSRIVDSYITVINLILGDAEYVDKIVLVRFDVQYKLPITYLGIDWRITNLPFKDLPQNWDEFNKVSDLFLVFPISHATAMIEALNRSDALDGDGGHYMYKPLIETLGRASVRFIDKGEGYTSDQDIQTTGVFLGIDRSCSKDYFQCGDDWLETTLH